MLGLPSIDQQHQQLVGMLNQLHDAMTARHGQAALGQILDDLIAYVHEHFGYEEGLLAKHGYRATSEHLVLHRQLELRVAEFREQYLAGRLGLSPSVLEFLRNWLVTHIGQQDARYVRHLRAKGVR